MSGPAGHALRIGDRLQAGDVLLELSAPRLPCAVFATRMGDPAFVKKFVQAARPGAYARVLHGGELTAGDRIELMRSTEDHPTLADVFVESHAQKHSAELSKRILASPVSRLQRPGLQRWAEQIGG